MAKKPPKKPTLYVHLTPLLKRRLDRVALHNSRKISAEVMLALGRYLDDEERKAGLPPLEGEQ